MCEHIAACVDDLALAMHEPNVFLETLQNKHFFKLKGSGPLSFHLGADFGRDNNNMLCMSPKKHINRMVDSCKQMFGEAPRTNMQSPLEKGDHPEIGCIGTT